MTRFNSKKDFLFSVLMFIPLIAALAFGFFAFQCTFKSISNGDFASLCVVGLLLIPLAIFTTWSWYNTYYEVDQEKMAYRSGLFKGSIPIKDINWVKKSSYPVGGSSPAWAWEGILINYRANHELFVSPAQRDEFITALSQQNSKMKIVKS